MAATAGSKRPATDDLQPEVSMLKLCPLGAGAEVGRSCLILRFKGKTIMLDCGLLPSFQGEEALPLLREIDPAEVDIVVITHFHIDHCAALPHFTERMAGFRGRIFATHPTIAVMRMVLQDFVRVNKIASDDDGSLYTQEDVDRCMDRMEPLDLRQRASLGGVQMTFYNAGHVLGACMALIEIAGVSVLYTGDYSCEEDRHLMAAEIPPGVRPDLLIVEATYGMQVHEGREDRERRFLAAVEKVVRRGGRCLIPVFALGRAQELMLILEEHWAGNPDLRPVPIYHASRMAERSLEVYRSATSYMNTRVQAAVGGKNPWSFQYVKAVQRRDFRDAGPCVMLAAPGMLQQGFSRELFDRWCEEPKNGVVLAGYSVEGTMARQLEANPVEVESMSRRRLVRRCLIERVSFSAHADSVQTAKFVDAVRPCAIVLVHGERSEMARLHSALARKYEGTPGFRGVRMPGNNVTFTMEFKEQKLARVVGRLAEQAMLRALTAGAAPAALSGLLITRNFEHLLLTPAELPQFTQLATHTVAQKLHVPYRSTFAMLKAFVTAMYAACVQGREAGEGGQEAGAPTPGGGRRYLVVSGLVTVTHAPPDRVLLSWRASPQADLIADSLMAVIGQAEVSQASIKATSRPCNHAHGPGGAHAGHSGGRGGMEEEEAPAVVAADGQPRLGGEEEEGDGDPIPHVVCLTDVPWARALLSSDTGPFSGADATPDMLSDTGAGPVDAAFLVGGDGGESDARRCEGLLAPPLRRRRNHLLRVLASQYGEGAVRYHPGVRVGAEEGQLSSLPPDALFSLSLSLDKREARVVARPPPAPPAAMDVEGQGAGGGGGTHHLPTFDVLSSDEPLRVALTRMVEVADALHKPVSMGSISSFGQ